MSNARLLTRQKVTAVYTPTKRLKRLISLVLAKQEDQSSGRDVLDEAEMDADLETRETVSSRDEQTWRRAYSRPS